MQTARSFPLAALTILVLAGGAVTGEGGSLPDGAALYQKHCSHCHSGAAKLTMADDLVDTLRMPPPGMPSFSEDKLSDAEVQALGVYIREGVVSRRQAVPVRPQAAPLATAEPSPAPSTAVTGTAPVLTGGQPKAKRTWHKAFARSWTIKRQQDGEAVTMEQFTISANARNEPEIALADRFSDYTVKVTAFHLTGSTLRLELTWGWKLNANYWKNESFDLRLSDDRKKLTGSYSLRTSGGQSADMPVWGE